MKIVTIPILVFAAMQSGLAEGRSCPIEIQFFAPASVLRPNGPVVFAVKLRNVSGKDIRGFKVQPAYFDATEDLHVIPVELASHQGVKSGKLDNPEWPSPFGDKTGAGWLVVVKKVLFEDGSTWVGSATEPCYAERWEDKKHPRLTKLPWELFTVKE
jgi:hypothetical protein